MKKLATFFLALFVGLNIYGNPYGVLVNGKTFFDSEIVGEFEGYMIYLAHVQVRSGDYCQLYDADNKAAWVVDLNQASIAGFTRYGEKYGVTVDGCFDFYIKFKYELDELYIDSGSNCGEGIDISGQGGGGDDKPQGAAGHDFYVMGWINGADAGEVAYDSFDEKYKFIDGKIKIDCRMTSYIGVKDDQTNYYYFQGDDFASGDKVTLKWANGWSPCQKWIIREGVNYIIIREINFKGEIQLERVDKATFDAYQFDITPSYYTFTISSDEKYGKVYGTNGTYVNGTTLSISAEANYGYHFMKWSDDNTDNPRTITLTQDTSIIAYFAPNKYSFSASCDEQYGEVSAQNGEYDYQTPMTITANAKYGYHFVEWSDGNTSNPRVIILTKDMNITALFAPNTYTISDNSDKSLGHIANAGMYTYLSEVELEATPNNGCHFTQWSDGNTDNPRTIELTQDTTFTAEFAIDKYGTCGDDNALIWTFDDQNVLTITGNGTLNSNYTFGVEAPESMQKVVIESGVSSVGNSAFKNQTTLKEIAISHGVNTIADEAFAGCTEVKLLTLGANLLSIGDNAFNGCKRIDEITVYAERVIDITESTFANIGKKEYVYVNVPEGSMRGYQRDDYWSEFDLRVIGATTTTVTDDEVNVQPTNNTADVTWPAVEDAATYELTIKDKDGNIICTLNFNAQGQLISIAFAAPGRGQSTGQIAGFTFTVTGLDSGSNYGFTMEAKNSQGEILDTKEGTFTTTGGIATATENASVDTKPTKVIRDGQIFILRDGKTYTVQGQEVR